MRRPCPKHSSPGTFLIVLGILILLSMVLPAGFWWFSLGVGLIVLGSALNRRRC